MKKIIFTITLALSAISTTVSAKENHNELKPESNNRSFGITVDCGNFPGVCAAIIGQIPANMNGWVAGCLVIGGTPSYCILR